MTTLHTIYETASDYEMDDTSDDYSSTRSPSPAPTLQTMSSSLYDALFDLKHGRIVNAACHTYSMAADEHEIVRMDQEHQLYKFLFQHQYGDDLFCAPSAVQSLFHRSDLSHRVYDFGTGTGAWAIDMARRYPNADVVGVDLAPLQPCDDALPPNCRMEVDNLNLPMDHYHLSPASLIHIRLLSPGITDYPGLIDNCARTLLPNGLLHILETDYRPYSAPNTQALLNTNSSPSVHWLRAVVAAMRAKHANVDAAANLRRWVKEHRALDEVEYFDEWLPLFPVYTEDTSENAFHNEIARRTQRDFLSYLENARPLLLDMRDSPEELDVLERKVREECASPRMQVFIRVCVICAKKVDRMTG